MFQRQPWMQRAGDFPASDTEYHELLARAVFSGGLGPKVVESRWPSLKAAFSDFDPAMVGAMGPDDVARLLSDAGVIRNRRKIEAVVENARVFQAIVEEHGAFHSWLTQLDAGTDLERAGVVLAERFRHLGPASAALFFFSAGWRIAEEAQLAQSPA